MTDFDPTALPVPGVLPVEALADLAPVAPELDEVEVPATAAFLDTPVDPEAGWTQPSWAYRALNWLAGSKVQSAYSVNIAAFSPERQAAVRDLVNAGLVSERRWVGGAQDGRTTYRLTSLGAERLAAAREAAALVVLG